ncbi:MAG TPA: hypothetical protein VGU69_15165 [Rhizomicrobium sp.]|nr:hypothetical protein [Rhizomicrobium sp.]
MRLPALVVLSLLALVPAARAQTTCNVIVDVTDTDPKGTNVRDAPSGKAIAVLAQPTGADDWIEVHITGQSGDWYEIDGAKLIGDSVKSVFKGKGYLHKSVLGVSGLQNGTTIWTDPDIKSHVIDPDAAGDQPVTLLGCSGDFLKVRVKKGTGWTKGACTNQRTTCA